MGELGRVVLTNRSQCADFVYVDCDGQCSNMSVWIIQSIRVDGGKVDYAAFVV